MSIWPIKYLSLPVFLLFLEIIPAFSQAGTYDSLKYNKIKIKSGHCLVIKDSIRCFNRDTLLSLPADNEFSIIDSADLKQRDAYQRIEKKASGNRIARDLVSVFIEPEVEEKEVGNGRVVNVTNPYLAYEGKVIRNIRIKHLPVFGSSIEDTCVTEKENWALRIGNRLNFNTRDYIIRKSLLFYQGGKLVPLVLSDNERILRNLSSIQDARILVDETCPGSDSVDIVVITRDLWSTGINFDLHSQYNFDCKVYNKNLGGFGLYFSNSILADTREDPSIGYKGRFSDENLGGSFIGMEVNFESYFHNQQAGIKFSRPFFTNQLKWGGGVEAGINEMQVLYQNGDTTIQHLPVSFDYADAWAGHLFNLEPGKKRRINVHQLIFSGRYVYRNYSQRPMVLPDSNQQFYNQKLFLTNLIITGHQYFKTNLVYGFGKTEDIPVGQMVEITGGYENNDFNDRIYGALMFAKADFLNRGLYYSYSLSVGGFIKDNQISNGAVDIQMNVFNRIMEFNNWKFRPFFKINYLAGINRYPFEFTEINDQKGIRGFSPDNLHGIQKFSMNFELVSFLPFSWYEFRFALFGFADLAAISMDEANIFNSRLYSGFGIGMRVRNENLVFKTFQVRIAVYPDIMPGMSHFGADLGGVDNLKTMDFNGRQPAVLLFQ